MQTTIFIAQVVLVLFLSLQSLAWSRTRKPSATRLFMITQHRPYDFSSAKIETKIDPSRYSIIDYRPVVVGIAGGSASGKTTLANTIIRNLGEDHISFIGHDSYYKNLDHLTIEERAMVNFDHPDALDTDLLVEHIRCLKDGNIAHVPTYDFNTHSRTSNYTQVQPRKIIVVDGILLFAEPKLLQLLDLKIFVDTADDIRLIRRIARDTHERGRSVQSVIDQYMRSVRPMHDLYVEPSKRKADIILPAGDGIAPAALDMCMSHLREIINFYQ